MAEPRPFPPSARRVALARAAGLHAASPVLVGALACAAAVIAVVGLGRAVAARLGSWVVAACESSARLPGAEPASGATPGHAVRGIPRAVLELAVPALVAIALAAIVAHLAQTRAVWLPRRRMRGAPSPDPARVRRATLDLTATCVIAIVAFGWVWLLAPRLAGSIAVPFAAPALIASFLATLAIAWVALGVIDALVRHAEVAQALRMSHADKREDDRLSGADPRWRQRRAELARGDRSRDARAPRARDADGAISEAIAGSSVLVLGDDVAVAIAWDPVHRPVPMRTATGDGARMTQLLGLARRHAIAVHRDPELATALAAGTSAVVPETTWPRLAEIIAATRHRRRSI
ncbi:MAG: FlhB HrpN YscU SpaS Family [Myxococcales bacterium]|nr:FlhB HrpN YscU SpaS Family [Myxococcales bacterium]